MHTVKVFKTYMATCLEEEIAAIEAIFCDKEDRFCMEVSGWKNFTDTIFSLILKLPLAKDGQISNKENKYRINLIELKCTFCISPSYPETAPDISLSQENNCNVVTINELELISNLKSYSYSLIGSNMLMDVIMWIKENVLQYVNFSSADTGGDNARCDRSGISVKTARVTYLLTLDHMRSKKMYLKTLEKWCKELGIGVIVVFLNKRILLLIQGLETSLKEFIVSMKTVNIDIDAKGRKCKERMLSLLHQIPFCEGHEELNGFQVKEYTDTTEFESLLNKFNLTDFYSYA